MQNRWRQNVGTGVESMATECWDGSRIDGEIMLGLMLESMANNVRIMVRIDGDRMVGME